MADVNIEMLLKEIEDLKEENRRLQEKADNLETNVECPQICQFCHCPFNFNQVKAYNLENAFYSTGTNHARCHFYDFCDKCINKLVETKKLEHKEDNNYILKKSFNCFINHLNKHKRLYCVNNDVQ